MAPRNGSLKWLPEMGSSDKKRKKTLIIEMKMKFLNRFSTHGYFGNWVVFPNSKKNSRLTRGSHF